MSVRTQFDLFLDKIRPHILDYLETKGYNTSHAIKCINPTHDDHNPSMLCAQAEQNDWRVWCTSCGWRADIFDAFAVLEDTPRKGAQWVEQTVTPLAVMFNIPSPVIDFTPEEQFCHDLYRTYEDIAALLDHDLPKWGGSALEYVESRKWTEETLKDLDIGVISYEKIQEHIPMDERERFGLNRPDVFSPENLIYTARDLYGRPVRFFGRRPEGQKPKFVSTASAGLTVNVWQNRGQLYLSHLLERSDTTCILVEGQSSAVALYQEGIRNVVASYGCKGFSEAHADTLALRGVSRVTILYDGDKEGQDAVEALLSKEFVRSGGLYYEVVVMPDNHDPDSYVREEGFDKLQNLLDDAKQSSFEFLLSKIDPRAGVESICEETVPYIAASQSDISREKMAKELSEHLDGDVSIGAILADVRRIDNRVVTEALEKQKIALSSMTRQIRDNPLEAKETLRSTLDRLDAIDRERSPKSSTASCLARLRANKLLEETRISGGYTLRPDGLGPLSDFLSGGDWAGSRTCFIAAVKNMGKSSFLDQFIWEALSNPDNNAIAYLLTLDDPVEVRFRRFGCISLGDKIFAQNMIANPRWHSEELGIEGVYEKREIAYSNLTKMISSGRLIIEGVGDGTTMAYAERRLAQIRRENPESNIIFGLDNFHDCSDWENVQETVRIGRLIKYGKQICEQHKALGMFTAEYRKLDRPDRPGTDDDLADSRKLGYAAALTMHLFSDLDDKDDEALLVHKHLGELLPRLIVNVGKNKITKVKGREKMIFDFYPSSSMFSPVSRDQAKADILARKEELAPYKQDAEPDESQ